MDKPLIQVLLAVIAIAASWGVRPVSRLCSWILILCTLATLAVAFVIDFSGSAETREAAAYVLVFMLLPAWLGALALTLLVWFYRKVAERKDG